MIERIKCFMPGLAQAWAPRHKMLSCFASLFLCVVVLFCCIPFEASAASSTDNYWFNGVELPPLPSEIDGYFKFIVRYPSNGYYYCVTCPSSYIPLLEVDSSDRNRLSISDGTAFQLYSLPLNASSWNVGTKPTSLPVSSYQFIASSHDVYFADSDIVAYKQTFNVPYSQKDIYSYNGLIAPSVFNLNSISYLTKYYIWQDKTTYDYYAYTFWDSSGWEDDNNEYHHGDLVDYYYASVRYKLVDGVWSESYSFTGGYYIDFSQYDIVWSSVDLTDLSGNLKFEGSQAVSLGNLTSLFSVLPEDDSWEVKQGSTKRFQLASSQNLDIDTVTWELKGNVVAGTFIDYSGLLTVADTQPLGSLYVVASNINGQGYSSEAAVTVISAQTVSTDWVIRTNHTGTFYAGNTYQFYLQNPSTSETGATAVWSIYSPNSLASGTTIDSSGLLTISANQNPAEVTVQASSINGEEKYATYTFYIFSGSGGGDTPDPTPTPGTQDVIDSIDEGLDTLGEKIWDLGDNIITGITEAIFRLFIPTSEELTALMNDFVDWVNTSFPILGIPMEFVSYTYDLFIGVTPELAIMNFPQIKVMDHVIIEETSLDLKQYEWLDTILPIIRTMLTMAACYAFGSWAIRRVKEIGKI